MRIHVHPVRTSEGKKSKDGTAEAMSFPLENNQNERELLSSFY